MLRERERGQVSSDGCMPTLCTGAQRQHIQLLLLATVRPRAAVLQSEKQRALLAVRRKRKAKQKCGGGGPKRLKAA